MKRKKGVFHCNMCNSPCEIYKKGKSHRVLVCPKCGILATNPLPLIPLAMMAGSALLSGGGKKDTTPSTPATQKIITDSLDKPNKGERYVKMALGG